MHEVKEQSSNLYKKTQIQYFFIVMPGQVTTNDQAKDRERYQTEATTREIHSGIGEINVVNPGIGEINV